MESGYLNAKLKFGISRIGIDNTTNQSKTHYTTNQSKTHYTPDENLKDFTDSIILKNIELIYGVMPAHAIIKYVSQHVGKSRLDILSNFETFSKNIIQVYGEVEGKKFLSKLPIAK